MDASAMMNQSFASMFGGVAGVPGTGNDMGQQQELLQQILGSSGFPAGMFGNMAGDQQQQQQEQQQENDKSLKYWNLLHFIMMCLLGFYAVYFEWMHAGPQRFAALTFDLPVGYPSIHVVSVIMY
jgi:hypothetical protein